MYNNIHGIQMPKMENIKQRNGYYSFISNGLYLDKAAGS